MSLQQQRATVVDAFKDAVPFGPAGAGDDGSPSFAARASQAMRIGETIGFKLGLPAGKGHGQQVRNSSGGRHGRSRPGRKPG